MNFSRLTEDSWECSEGSVHGAISHTGVHLMHRRLHFSEAKLLSIGDGLRFGLLPVHRDIEIALCVHEDIEAVQRVEAVRGEKGDASYDLL